MHRRTFPSLLVGLLAAATIYVGMPVSNAVAAIPAVLPVAVPAVAPVSAPAAATNKLRWSRNRVYVVDKAHSRWPVNSMAERLDNGSGLNLVVVKKCPSETAQCITVRSKERVKGKPVGLTWTWTSAGYIVKAEVELENAYGRTQNWSHRASLTIHELGHAVGLPHVTRRSSPMYKYILGVYRLDKSDKKKMAGLYPS